MIFHFFLFFVYSSRFFRSNPQHSAAMKTDITMATMKPYFDVSMPLMRFIPKSEAMSVGIIMMMVTDVSVRITVFMLLLMMLE